MDLLLKNVFTQWVQNVQTALPIGGKILEWLHIFVNYYHILNQILATLQNNDIQVQLKKSFL